MKKRNVEGSRSMLNAENVKNAERYVRTMKKAQDRRDTVQRMWQEISEINRRGIC